VLPRPQCYQKLPRLFLGPIVLLAGFVGGVSPALADAVTDWNAFADMLPLGSPPQRNRIGAMMHVAIHDALNSIDPRYESYGGVAAASPDALPASAVAAAAYEVLISQAPASQSTAITTFYNNTILALPECPSAVCTAGTAAGQAAAYAILALRAGDGSATPHLPYTLAPSAGVYQQTPGTPPAASLPPQFAGWALVTPFILHSGSQFRAEPGELFDLTSEEYTRDFNEVKRVGSLNAQAEGNRTADQSAIARFWPGGGSNWNAVTRIILSGRGLNSWQHAHLFALLNMALSDGNVAVFDTKYAYNFWRPVTAIRQAASDGNPATAADESWISYQNTPPYPDYTCGLTTGAGAGTEVLRRYFGTDHIAYTLTAPPPTNLTRSFTSLSQAASEAVDARVFGGMHFRTGCVRGVIQGKQVGRFVFQHALRPLRKPKN
jgi:hypothetical protein